MGIEFDIKFWVAGTLQLASSGGMDKSSGSRANHILAEEGGRGGGEGSRGFPADTM